jgi:hypothetical protein
MIDGFYAIYYTGVSGAGLGVLVVNNGIIVGADMVGGRYDGTYTQNKTTGNYDGKIRITIPPGGSLVTGVVVGAQPFQMDVTATLPPDLGGEKPVRIETPTGPVNVIFRKLRDYPTAI